MSQENYISLIFNSQLCRRKILRNSIDHDLLYEHNLHNSIDHDLLYEHDHQASLALNYILVNNYKVS